MTEVMTCPGGTWTFDLGLDEALFLVGPAEKLDVGPDGETLRGRYEEVTDTVTETWEWDLVLDDGAASS